MAEQTDTVPDGPIPGAKQIGYFWRQFKDLTAQQTLPLILVFLVGWLLYSGYLRDQHQQTVADEAMSQFRRDRDTDAEKYRLSQIENTKVILAHCAAMDKAHRDESRTHMAEAMLELGKLRMAIDKFSGKIEEIKAPQP